MKRWELCLLLCCTVSLGPVVTSCGVKKGNNGQSFRGTRASSLEGSVDYLDSRYGFRDLEFGSRPTSDMKLSPTQDTELTESYERPGESMQLEGGKAEAIRYVYFDGALTSIQIETRGRDNSRKVLGGMWTIYGTTHPKRAPTHSWQGRRVVLSYREQPKEKASIVMWSRAMMEPVTAAWKARERQKQR